jgi:hypothetical protein
MQSDEALTRDALVIQEGFKADGALEVAIFSVRFL